VPFGKGYLSTFLESLNDIYVFENDRLILFANAKYTYNWSTRQTMRLAPTADMPLTREKEEVEWSPGAAWTLTGGAESRVLWDLRLFSNYIWYTKNRDRMSGSRSDYDYSILSTGTDVSSRTAEFGAFYTTTDLYLRNKFPVPFKIAGSYSQTLTGQNTEIIDMAYLELQLYF
ncbi:MAG TPA: hypothetical protein VFV50_19105, partial [Bdellovibrionales bacterium]|nr:hypothetical protein [Bdellovibrionales bacterium]